MSIATQGARRRSPARLIVLATIKRKPMACKACLGFERIEKIPDALLGSADHNARIDRQKKEKVVQIGRDTTQTEIFRFS
ncbi:hypothetical protein H4684_003794 [Desulfomicrobium macestii]|uniref:Uncharacterized protein n=1 Tax=Desulfomicrobium macestii TaxID=90731 RepID=A0ABR9H8S6_9BACT|nr:hypothetical protein [Desulfomicrobium macestii]MBE1427106.1 hypothetical protein [Desulfomicrobium macestii]